MNQLTGKILSQPTAISRWRTHCRNTLLHHRQRHQRRNSHRAAAPFSNSIGHHSQKITVVNFNLTDPEISFSDLSHCSFPITTDVGTDAVIYGTVVSEDQLILFIK